MEALREGEEGGVELVVLVGLAESSCGDVGKAHVRTGLGLARSVDSGTAARTRGHGPPRRVPSGTCVFWGSRHPLPWAHQDEAPRSHSWAGLLPDKVTGSGTLTVGPSGMTLAFWPASGAAREIPIVNGAVEGSRWGSAPPPFFF